MSVRTLFLVILPVLLLSLPSNARQAVQAKFDLANTMIENGQYNEALHEFRSIENEGFVSGPLYLNMGISALQIDSLGLAKYYLLKAFSFKEVSEESLDALEYVNSQFSRQSATLPKLPWDQAIDWMKTVPKAFGVFLVGYFFAMIGLILLLGRWFGFLSFKKQTQFMAGFIISSFLILILSFYVEYVNQRYDEAILIIQETRVLEQPKDDANLVSMSYEGYSLTVDKKKSTNFDNWYYVRLGNGQFGWIEHKGVIIL